MSKHYAFNHEELRDFIVVFFMPIYEAEAREVDWEGVSDEDKHGHILNWALQDWNAVLREIKEDEENT